ncbi:MAG: phosphatidylglycerophosphatase A [Phycisphaerales bacterium]|nr:phosphatidylglycerophosphatase A [Phycisphaerales bacterium]
MNTDHQKSSSARPSPAAVFRSMGVIPALAVTAGGLGFLRPASGTWGSLPPAVVAAFLAISGAAGWQIDLVLLLLLGIGCVACLRFGRSAEAIMGKKDPGQVVADEIAGQALTLLALPWAIADGWAGSSSLPEGVTPMVFNIGLAVVGFLLFRVFDILKPPPANGLQRLGGGMGILVDDLITGAMAAAVLQIGVRFFY